MTPFSKTNNKYLNSETFLMPLVGHFGKVGISSILQISCMVDYYSQNAEVEHYSNLQTGS